VSHIYIHVPFCRRRCSYCDFSIAVRKTIPAAEYVDAVRSEMALLRHDRRWPIDPLRTVYFGGGTPSLLDPDALRTILLDVARSTPSFDAVEITLEANPEDVTPDRAAAWRALGINRVSLGGQSFDRRVLEWMHRSHDGTRIADAVRDLRGAGVANISLDLIFALPDELERDWERDLDQAVALEPDHISLYGLTVEERTPLARWISRGAVGAPDDDRYAREYLRAHERLGAAEYEFYEVSNAARPGRRSRHNSAYWSGASYTGLGPAAHSYDGRARRWNAAPWEAYRARIAAGESAVAQEEVLTTDQRRLEEVFLGLRTVAGLSAERIPGALAATWQREGWVEVSTGAVRCTPEGWLRLDALVRALTGNLASSQIVTVK
jgi:oxygen-independent coproporphyrinogen-3 oxidase